MKIKCLFGHNWNGCKCQRCGETRDEGHRWNGCICNRCGKQRDEGHDWDRCSGRCRICGKTCPTEHKWNGCKCTLCGGTRDEEHDWDRCAGKCRICGKTCPAEHKWNGCKCTLCGKTRNEGHNWDGCKCIICGRTRDEDHDWSESSTKGLMKCARCGAVKLSPDADYAPSPGEQGEIDSILQEMLPIYRRLESNGTAETPADFNTISSCCNRIMERFGGNGVVYAVQSMKKLSRFGVKRMAQTWEFVITRVGREESHMFDAWL